MKITLNEADAAFLLQVLRMAHPHPTKPNASQFGWFERKIEAARRRAAKPVKKSPTRNSLGKMTTRHGLDKTGARA